MSLSGISMERVGRLNFNVLHLTFMNGNIAILHIVMPKFWISGSLETIGGKSKRHSYKRLLAPHAKDCFLIPWRDRHQPGCARLFPVRHFNRGLKERGGGPVWYEGS